MLDRHVTVGHIQLGQARRDMVRDSPAGQMQRSRDFGVRRPSREQLENLLLTAGQAHRIRE